MAGIASAPRASLLEDTAPRVLFADLVAGALDRTGVVPTAQACAYLVDLLADRVRPAPVAEGADACEETFAEGLLGARSEPGRARVARLRVLGDRALFRVGFFVDNLEGRRNGAGWVREVGRMAYGDLAGLLAGPHWRRARLFEELADRFGDFAEVLTEVGDGTRTAAPAGLVSLSDRYLRLGREADRRRLQRRGLVVPPEAVGRLQ
ncbi:MAG: hypothetical protein JRH16_13825 [Deltaproteobacteria bacterium]|nr:hypothetical protein [Deltaproteobacteria bacterium]MBW2359800.1 hypothetical protein [Deltaproteobacteria bacterium]